MAKKGGPSNTRCRAGGRAEFQANIVWSIAFRERAAIGGSGSCSAGIIIELRRAQSLYCAASSPIGTADLSEGARTAQRASLITQYTLLGLSATIFVMARYFAN